MRVHNILHVPFEGLGYIGDWLVENNHSLTTTHVWEAPYFPRLDDFDGLIIMGGPMGVYDEHFYNWLSAEKKFILDAIGAEKKIIGVCLGAQLIASVLGATVSANKYKEIGWYPIRFAPSFSEWLGVGVPSEINVFHWHGDKFDIPANGKNHASSEACNHQLFTYGENIIGLQFHLEATEKNILAMLDNCSSELAKGPFVSERQEILGELQQCIHGHRLLEQILKKFCSKTVGQSLTNNSCLTPT